MERLRLALMVLLALGGLVSALSLRPGVASGPERILEAKHDYGVGGGGSTTSTLGSGGVTTTTFSREDSGCSVTYSVYGAPNLGAVEMELDLLNGSLGAWEDCDTAVAGATISAMQGARWRLEQLAGAISAREQPLFVCELLVHHADSIPTLADSTDLVAELAAELPDGNAAPTPKVCISRVNCDRTFGTDPDDLDSGVCGDATGDREILSSDALRVLSAAVGGASCKQRACDTDGNGSITATDAVRVLAASVGLPDTLECPPPC